MSNNEIWLYLMSSNAKKEYILDALETLALPKGAIQHYRYQLKYLGKDLIDMLPVKSGLKSELTNAKVLSNYLYQTKEGGNWIWMAAYPVRFGTLMDAYKTGYEDFDIAHFYFEVEEHVFFNYLKAKDKEFFKLIESKSKYEGKPAYAFYKDKIPYEILHPSQKDRSDFISTCERFVIKDANGEPLKDADGKPINIFTDLGKRKEYVFPVFCYIHGIMKNGKEISPAYVSESRKSIYDLTEGERYTLEYEIYSNQDPPKYSVKLLSGEKIFSNVNEYERESDCRYDEDSFFIIPSLVERDIATELNFELRIEDSNMVKDKEPLDLKIILEANINRSIWYRIFDATAEVGFGIGTGLIAFSRVVNQDWFDKHSLWWWGATGFFYALWIILKYVVKLWKIKRRKA